jgi:hypothetical protein
MTTLLEALADMRHYIRCGPEAPEECPACVRYDALQVEALKAMEELAEAKARATAVERSIADLTDVLRDAERYRWLIENAVIETDGWRSDGRDAATTKQPVDAAIDAARKETP